MPSGNFSVGGTCTRLSLRLPGAAGTAGIVLVTSAAATGAALIGGIATDAVLSGALGAEVLSDCRPIGVGEVIDGAGAAGLALFSAGDGAGACGSLESSMA